MSSGAIPWSPIFTTATSPLSAASSTLEDGDVGVMVYRDGEGTLKRFHRRADGVALEPFNQAYETLVITGWRAELDQLYALGRVVETKTRW